MFEEYMKAQGTVIPSMFIGIGGIGSRIVDRIARRAESLPNWEAQLRGLTTFVCMDTNILDLNALRHIPGGSRIHIGAVDKRKIVENYRASKNRQALQWIDRNYQPREGVKPGAGQIRVESRLGYHYASPSIRAKLDELIRYTLDPSNNWRQNNPRNYYVYLYCSLAGGTGSGSFLPVAYLIQDLLNRQGWQPRVIGNFVLSTLLTRKVAPDLHPNIHANTYAALKELEHMAKLNYQSVRLERPSGEPFVFWNNENTDDIPMVNRSALFHSFLFDRPVETDVQDLEETLGDGSFLQVFTPIINNVAAEYDNYEQHNQSLTHFPGDNRNVGQGYTKNFGAFGTAALVLPAEELLEYCALRFAGEALRRQITFGAGAGSSDQRERALDRLKINYDDPAFRNLDESARHERINDSFLSCVQTLAKFDSDAGMKDGYWNRMVEAVDRGQLKGMDEKTGKEIRTETLAERVLRHTDDERKPVMDQVSIKSRAFVFTQEGVNQYQELLTKFKEDIRTSTVKVELGKAALRASAAEGVAMTNLDPKPTPLQERYLVIQLLKLCDGKLIPEAIAQLDKARAKSFINAGIQERLERELPGTLNDAAKARRLMGTRRDDDVFIAVRNSAQEEFQEVARSHVRFFDADLKLAQYQSLRDYLVSRARQFALLATRINELVRELEADAESVRSGVAPKEARLALSVEVFETLLKPRTRIWDRVYEHLYIREGRDMSTFDRQVLATEIGKQLDPVKDPQSGRYVPKSEYGLVADLKRSMKELGRSRLRKAIYGDQDQRGLSLESALDIEARLVLPQDPGRPLTDEAIHGYMEEKFKAVNLMASMIARTRTEEMRSLDDGVKLARKRHFLIQEKSVSPAFVKRFEADLTKAGWDLATDKGFENPHVALVHDTELPIPLYYFEAINQEIEEAYEKVMSNERRAFHLHTDFNWEHSLPDLNPRKAEIGVTWSLEVLLDGILTKTVAISNGQWVWKRNAQESETLGDNLAVALYSLVGLYEDDVLGSRLKVSIADAVHAAGPAEMRDRVEKFRVWVGKVLEDIAIRGRRQEKSREDELEMPILRSMQALSKGRFGGDEGGTAPASSDTPPTASLGTSMGF